MGASVQLEHQRTHIDSSTMKLLVLFGALVLALVSAEPEADPAGYRYGLGYYGRGYGYRGYGYRGYGYRGYRGKREAEAEPQPEADADPAVFYSSLYAGYPYAYGAYAAGYRFLKKREAEAEPEAKPEAEADPYFYAGYPYAYGAYPYAAYGAYPYAYGAYPYTYAGYHLLKKRDAEAEAEPAYGYRGYGYSKSNVPLHTQV